MSKLPPQLLEWLFRVLQPEYSNPVLAYQDISLILTCFPYLKVKTDVHVIDLGKEELMVKVYGTNEQEVTFEIWIPHEYPRMAPLIYIKAGPGRQVVPNNYLDANGRFYHPFLSDWMRIFGQDVSNDEIPPKNNRLLRLVQIFLDTIQKYPPISNSNSTPPIPKLPPKPASPTPVEAPRLTKQKINLMSMPADKPTEVSKPPLLPPNPNRSQVMNNLKVTLEGEKSKLINTFDTETLQRLIQLQNQLLKLTERTINDRNYLSFLSETISKQDKLLETKTEEMAHLNDSLEKSYDESVAKFDSHLVAETPVFNQLYELVTKLKALEDLFYNLDKLHDSGKLKFDLYLRNARQIAREQCLVKLHIEKLAQICSLDTAA
ncbi:hypothetical protein KL905_000044 [Ogataea polymorpha]|nr:hypothetical protein KL906_000622 [Ogataea polymorpha]KAG7923890.1 hypothetical protein KL905_000044 [Ogataea polymorpha]